MTPALAIDELSVRYPASTDWALNDVSLSLDPAQALAVIGASGAGKTTLALAALALLPPSTEVRGRVQVDGADMQPSLRGRTLAMAFQSPSDSFNPARRVGAQVVEVAALDRPMTPSAQRAFVRARLQEVELDPALADAWPHQLSGGQLRRAALAMVLATDPRVLIADEPAASLDPLRRGQVMALLRRLRSERQLALLLITHDLSMAKMLCASGVVLRDGRVVETGKMDALLEAPNNAYTAALGDAARARSGKGPAVGDFRAPGNQ